MRVVGALFVIGVSGETRTYDDVTDLIDWHLTDGRIYSSVRLRGLWRNMPVFARAVGSGELCLAGACLSLDAEDQPHPLAPERWPLSYRVHFESVLRGVPAADVLRSEARTRRVRGLGRESVTAARAAFMGARTADEWRGGPS